jgi:thiazole synthase
MTTTPSPDTWELGGKSFASRLMIGTSMYPNPELMFRAIRESGAEIVTVSIRRMDLRNPEHTFLSHDFMKGFQLLPNTSGCYTAREAVFTAELAREALGTNWIKVEVIGTKKLCFPTRWSCSRLAKNSWPRILWSCPIPTTTPSCASASPIWDARRSCPWPSPIGTGLGIRNPHNLQLIRDAVSLPLIVDAGIGTASDAAIAMELGYDGILLNTAIAQAQDPVLMARAMRLGIEAGRAAYRAGRIPKSYHAKASSPQEGRIFGP